MSEWSRFGNGGWPDAVEMLTASGMAWKAHLVHFDLNWHADQRVPLAGAPALMRRWNWERRAVDHIIASEREWRDPYVKEHLPLLRVGQVRSALAGAAKRTATVQRLYSESDEVCSDDTGVRAQSPEMYSESAAAYSDCTATVQPHARVVAETQKRRSNDPPNPPARRRGTSLTEKAAVVADLVEAALLDLPDHDRDVAVDAHIRPDAALVERWKQMLRGPTAVAVDGTRQQTPPPGVPDGLRKKEIEAGIRAGAARVRARGPPVVAVVVHPAQNAQALAEDQP